MNVSIKPACITVKIRAVKAGDFFRFANGNNTDVAYIALQRLDVSYNTVLLCRNLNTGVLKRLYVNTRKERDVTMLEPISIEFRDTTMCIEDEIQDDDENPVPEDPPMQLGSGLGRA